MDALSLLKEDHQRVRKLVREVEGTTARSMKERGALFQAILDELAVHERIEEEVFYPKLEKHEKAKELVLGSCVEHDVVDDLLDEISMIEVGDDRWLRAFKVFRENLEHLIEEEEQELFPKTKTIFSEEQLAYLGAEMAALKEQAQMERTEEEVVT
jgi:hemerythrin-like domain-containing protein